MAYMESLGLIELLGEGESSGGRPPELLQFNAGHGYVAGADIGGTRLRMMLCDLNGAPVAHWSTQFTTGQKDPVSVCEILHEGLRTMCQQAGVSLERVLHLTAGAPGITDVKEGVVFYAPNLTDWTNVPLRALLEKTTGIASAVENDTNLAAVGEYHQGSAKGVGDFIFIAMGTGVGAGIFLRGYLHHGARWSAGEMGYLGVPGMPRETVNMQSVGQLERMIGGLGVEERWIQRLKRSGYDHEGELVQLRASQIFDLAQEGDPMAMEVLHETAVVLADAIATMTLLFNPELIVLGGGVGSHDCLCRTTERLLQANDFTAPRLRTSFLGTQAQLYGAISLSLAAIESKLLC
jgi:glucokinase